MPFNELFDDARFDHNLSHKCERSQVKQKSNAKVLKIRTHKWQNRQKTKTIK